jgi:hypothetical protein
MSFKPVLTAIMILSASMPAAAQTITASPNIGPWQLITTRNVSGEVSYLLNTSTGELFFCVGSKCAPAHPAGLPSK